MQSHLRSHNKTTNEQPKFYEQLKFKGWRKQHELPAFCVFTSASYLCIGLSVFAVITDQLPCIWFYNTRFPALRSNSFVFTSGSYLFIRLSVFVVITQISYFAFGLTTVAADMHLLLGLDCWLLLRCSCLLYFFAESLEGPTYNTKQVFCKLLQLLYIEVVISFLIGRTVNFGNQRL